MTFAPRDARNGGQMHDAIDIIRQCRHGIQIANISRICAADIETTDLNPSRAAEIAKGFSDQPLVPGDK